LPLPQKDKASYGVGSDAKGNVVLLALDEVKGLSSLHHLCPLSGRLTVCQHPVSPAVPLYCASRYAAER
jgi:hypothetical protein